MENSGDKAFSLVELMVAIAIIFLAATIGMVSFSSLSKRKALQSEAENVKQDIYLMQSRAISGLRTQRFVIVNNYSYQLEEDSTGTGNWSIFQGARVFKPGIYFYGYTGKENKLWYESNGLPNFNGQTSSPFFSLINDPTNERKDFNIDASGVVGIDNN